MNLWVRFAFKREQNRSLGFLLRIFCTPLMDKATEQDGRLPLVRSGLPVGSLLSASGEACSSPARQPTGYPCFPSQVLA